LNQTLHQEERRQFERLLCQQRLDRVGDRLSVLAAFLAKEEHVGAQDLQELLQTRGMNLEPAFVAQTLELMTRLGLAQRRDFEGRPPVYEHQHLGEHHDHLICTRCGKIEEFHDPQLEALQEKVAAQAGFHPLRHKLHIYGLCRECLADRRPTLPLPLASAGETVRIERISGGAGLAAQMADLGLNVGSEVSVISSGGGHLVLAAKGARLALGRGAAQKILVSQVAVNPRPMIG
jgi:Fur family ferric uptake transcriptional regulator